MNNTNTTPPVLKTLFPLKENKHLVDALAAKKGMHLFVMDEYILFEGDLITTDKMRHTLVGGVIA